MWCRIQSVPQSHAGTGYRVGTDTKLGIAMDYCKRREDGVAAIVAVLLGFRSN
jgi:hypothetical protein